MTSLLLTYKAEQTQQVYRCIQAGADDGIPQPFNFDLLGARVRASLERKYLRSREINLVCELLEGKKKKLNQT